MGDYEGVPSLEVRADSLLSEKYGLGRDLQFDITGVVTGICVYQTAVGLRRKFPFAKINVISDATKQLTIPELGIPDDKTGDAVVEAMLKQVGVNYLTTDEYLNTLE